MLLVWSLIAAIAVLPVVLRLLAGPDEPDNVTEHVQEDEPRDDEDPDLLVAAA